jgi:hypothetical protein
LLRPDCLSSARDEALSSAKCGTGSSNPRASLFFLVVHAVDAARRGVFDELQTGETLGEYAGNEEANDDEGDGFSETAVLALDTSRTPMSLERKVTERAGVARATTLSSVFPQRRIPGP